MLNTINNTQLEAMHRTARREAGMRRKVYPKLIARRKMTQQQADEERENMELIRDLLKHFIEERKNQPGLFDNQTTTNDGS